MAGNSIGALRRAATRAGMDVLAYEASIGLGSDWRVVVRDGIEIEVPMRADCRDYPRRFRELLADLHRIESRSIADIVEEMSK